MKFPYETPYFTITNARDARYTCPEGTHLTCTLTVVGGHFGEDPVDIPFTASATDAEEHGKEVFAHFKRPKKYVKPAVTIYELQGEFDELMIDIQLGLASEEEIARAKELRIQIKGMR